MRVRVHRSRYKCHNRALCNSVDVLTTRVEFPSLPLWLFFFPSLSTTPGRFISPSILRTMQRFTQQYTIRGFNPLRTRDSYQGSFRDDSLATVSFYLDTPVTVNLLGVCSNSWTMFQGFFFFLQKFIFFKFSTVPSKLSEIQVLSVFTISKCPSRIEISNFSDFLASKFARIFRKSFDLHVFETFNIFFFQYSNKFLPNFPISNIKLFEFLLSAL